MSARGEDQIAHGRMEALLRKAADRLIADDGHLLRHNVSERAITHKLAEHLQIEIRQAPELREWHVDCEYNRDGHVAKSLQVSQSDSDGDFAVTVLPDIIVHQRGHNEANLLVIEAKKSSNVSPREWDIEKLEGFMQQLQYRFAAFVELKIGCDPSVEIQWIASR